jgi:hypothetical protein
MIISLFIASLIARSINPTESNRNPGDGSEGRIIITTNLINIHLISARLQYRDSIFPTCGFGRILTLQLPI